MSSSQPFSPNIAKTLFSIYLTLIRHLSSKKSSTSKNQNWREPANAAENSVAPVSCFRPFGINLEKIVYLDINFAMYEVIRPLKSFLLNRFQMF